MESLFPMPPAFPSGFRYQGEFITRDEEHLLIDLISRIPLHTFVFQGFEAKRKVASFGYDYSFDHRALSKGKEIPQDFHWLIKKAAEFTGVDHLDFAELLVTEYPIGSVINWHRDAPPFDLIVGISLRADCVFKFRPHDEAKRNRKATVSVPVQRRSVYVLQGESRTEWQHSISPVRDVRYSITLRTLKK